MPPVVALVDDLLALSRIRECARAAGLDVRGVRSPADATAAASDGGRLVLVDADGDRLPWAEAVAALRRDRPDLPVVAFVSHARADRAEAARAAGCTRVLARSAFVEALPQLVAAAAAPPPSEEPAP